ncbi:MAG: hypothetical protein JWQ38_879 [Flavipsychrobacter sp.]|nr:hypothetical protein [Flavipsychrobacter sp.]
MADLATTYITCPGCGLQLPDKQLPSSDQYNASGECRELYHQLSYYTLAKGDTDFIHEVIVDTYGAQHGGTGTSDMTIFFAIAGLYLHLERGKTGKQARQAHVDMAQHKCYKWPSLVPPAQKEWLTIADVIAADDSRKDALIEQWAASTWLAWQKDIKLVSAVCSDVLSI